MGLNLPGETSLPEYTTGIEDFSVSNPFSSPEPTILLVCARDRDLWQGLKQQVRESRTSGFVRSLRNLRQGSRPLAGAR